MNFSILDRFAVLRRQLFGEMGAPQPISPPVGEMPGRAEGVSRTHFSGKGITSAKHKKRPG
ncbi:hypothetical protein GFL58_36700 [Rhizobium leguminosarum bv. viciae]|nr:hypothetical protein [Rhizobium leguminosarum bv. viciae]